MSRAESKQEVRLVAMTAVQRRIVADTARAYESAYAAPLDDLVSAWDSGITVSEVVLAVPAPEAHPKSVANDARRKLRAFTKDTP